MCFKEYIINRFNEYASNYDIKNPKIALKISHTYRVASLCEVIAKSLDLSEKDIKTAWVCGMLHDIGRFEQVKRFGTFFDAKSVDHAQFGADILFNEGLYEAIVPKDFDSDYDEVKYVVEKAIRVHNVFKLPEDLSKKEKIFSDILRDADKIDILRVNYETPSEEIYNVTTEELKNSLVSEDVKRAYYERRCAKRHDRTTPVDFLVGHICLSFELVYPKSKELAFEQGYLLKLLDFESNIPETKDWFEYMKNDLSDYFRVKS